MEGKAVHILPWCKPFYRDHDAIVSTLGLINVIEYHTLHLHLHVYTCNLPYTHEQYFPTVYIF